MDAGRLPECRMLGETGGGLPTAVDSGFNVCSQLQPHSSSNMGHTFHFWQISPCFLMMAAKFFHSFARIKAKVWSIYYINLNEVSFAALELLKHRKNSLNGNDKSLLFICLISKRHGSG